MIAIAIIGGAMALISLAGVTMSLRRYVADINETRAEAIRHIESIRARGWAGLSGDHADRSMRPAATAAPGKAAASSSPCEQEKNGG